MSAGVIILVLAIGFGLACIGAGAGFGWAFGLKRALEVAMNQPVPPGDPPAQQRRVPSVIHGGQ